MSRAKVICVQPMSSEASPSMLKELFCFHGAIERVSIKGEVCVPCEIIFPGNTVLMRARCSTLSSRLNCVHAQVGFVEFASASSTASALLFDRTKLAGNTVSVAVVEEELPDEVWDAELEGEELFEKVDHADTRSPPASPAAPAFDQNSTALPPPAVLPAPEASVASGKQTRKPTKASPAHDTAKANAANATTAAAAAGHASASAPAKSLSVTGAAARAASLEQLAKEPINSAAALLAATLAFELLALLLYV